MMRELTINEFCLVSGGEGDHDGNDIGQADTGGVSNAPGNMDVGGTDNPAGPNSLDTLSPGEAAMVAAAGAALGSLLGGGAGALLGAALGGFLGNSKDFATALHDAENAVSSMMGGPSTGPAWSGM